MFQTRGQRPKLRERFKIGRVIVVADRGMISKKSIEMLQAHPTQPLDFILGCRMRNQKEVRDQVLSQAGPWQPVVGNLGVQQVSIEGRRAVVGNQGFARFMHVTKGAMTINRAAIEADARYDGKFVLHTNTELPADEVAGVYKSLWRAERTFRETKSTLEVRPIFHHRDDTTIGHIGGAFSPSVSKRTCGATSSSVRSTLRGPT